MNTALIVGGGEIDPLMLASISSTSNLVLCADRGADVAFEAGIVPDIIIGDFDSLSNGTRNHFQRIGVSVITDLSDHHLDTESAIKKAVEMGAERLIVLGCWGDRVDQSLASLTFLTPVSIPLSTTEKDGCSFSGEVFLVTERCLIQKLSPGAPVHCGRRTRTALVPLPAAEGVTTRGFQYELNDMDLVFSRTWSVSNSAVEDDVEVTFRTGALALIQWFGTSQELRSRLMELTGRAQEMRADAAYHSVLKQIYDHGGTTPLTTEEKDTRLGFTRKLLDKLCPGHGAMNIIHIAGTSGKGSVAMYLHSILSRKFDTGLILSPHVYDFNERIQVNTLPIPHADVVSLWDQMRNKIEVFEREHNEILLFQEIILLMAFTYFTEQNIQWVVVETGLGGRFDQTRVLEADVTIITQIDLDHTHILGNTIQEIAMEKAGIIRPGIPLYTAEQKEEAIKVFKDTCNERSAPFYPVYPDTIAYAVAGEDEAGGMLFSHEGTSYSIPHHGEHMAVNTALAVAAVSNIPGVSGEDIRGGLQSAYLPGRIEVRGRLVIDTAHNPAEIRALSKTLSNVIPGSGKKIVVCGISDTKDHLSMLREIGRLGDIIIFTRAGYRGQDPMELKHLALTLEEFRTVEGIVVVEKSDKAYALARDMTGLLGNDAWLIVTGSTFLIDEIFNPDHELRRINSGK